MEPMIRDNYFHPLFEVLQPELAELCADSCALQALIGQNYGVFTSTYTRMSAVVFIACALTLFVAVLSKSFFTYFTLINVLSFALIAVDKLKANNQFYRIREVDIYIMFGFGGWVGGLAAMTFFRHKTRKGNFLVSITIASVVNILITMKFYGYV